MINFRKQPIILTIMVISVLAMVYSGFRKRAVTMEKLTIAEASQPIFAFIYIANAKGYLREAGLDVTFKKFTSGRDALNSVIQGEADIATVLETPLVLQTYAGDKLSAISTLHESTRNTLLIARSDRGVIHPFDLTGKKVAVSKTTNSEFFLRLFLESHGIDEKRVSILDAKPGDMATLIQKGAVDAVATWNPHAYDARMALPKESVRIFHLDVYTEFSGLAGLTDVVLRRSSAMIKLLKALLRAEHFLDEHPQESLEIVIKSLPEASEATIRATWDDFHLGMQLHNIMLTVFQQQAERFHAAGRFSSPAPDFQQVVFKDYLRALKPESVTIR